MIKKFEAKIAQRMLNILDLTALNLETNVMATAEDARSVYGDVASVSVFPQFIAPLKPHLQGSAVRIACVANFPSGDLNSYKARDEINKALALGADEIEVVFPYYALLNRQAGLCLQFIQAVRAASEGAVLKVIIETGALESLKWIRKASEVAIRGGADFIVTSTGRYKTGATLHSAEIILNVIKDLNPKVGIKVSGGIDTYASASKYLELALEIMGSDWVTIEHFRIGASQLHHSLIETIKYEANASTE